MKPHIIPVLGATLLVAGLGQAAPAGDPAAGKSAWQREVPAGNGQPRSCATCHGSDPTRPGKHVRTGKRIAPMAPSVNRERFTDPAKVAKWFTRNCKWTWGRECTAAEQADIKAYLYNF
jgi:mono/diheme cytochrome c family protein